MAKRYERKYIANSYRAYDITDLDDLRRIIAESDHLNDVSIDVWDDSGMGGDSAPIIEVTGWRMETDDERSERLAEARKRRDIQAGIKAAAEIKEREKLRDLLAKYPDEAEPWTMNRD